MSAGRSLLLVALFCALAAGAPAGQAPASPAETHRLHSNPREYIAALDDPKRDAYQKPHEVIEALALRPGEVVADIGAGSGYFALRFGRHVGETGRVYAVDVSADMVLHMNRRIRDLSVRNVVTILAPPDDPLLPDASADRFFFCNVWHHVDDKSKYLSLLRRMLKPGGEVVMIDFHKRDLPVGPPMAMKLEREEVVGQMERAGFRLVREHTFLPYQYFLVFTAPR